MIVSTIVYSLSENIKDRITQAMIKPNCPEIEEEKKTEQF